MLLFCFVLFLMAVCDSQCVFSSQPDLEVDNIYTISSHCFLLAEV